MKLKKTISFLLLICIAMTTPWYAQAQSSYPNADIYKTDATVMFAGIENHVRVYLKSIKESEVTVSATPKSAILQRLGVNESGEILYSVIPSVPGEVKIVVNAYVSDTYYDLGYETFVVKPLPQPYITIGSAFNGDAIPRQQFPDSIGVVIPGPFFSHIHFSILSFKLSHSGISEPLTADGNTFTPQMLQSIKELPIGESITLYDVIVKLPSSETVSLGATFTLR